MFRAPTSPSRAQRRRVSGLRDAFRGYEPSGEQGRMVMLFLGLCEAAGIVKSAATAKPPSRNGAGRAPGPRTKAVCHEG